MVVVDEERGEGEPSDRRVARSRADFTFSRVQTLWYAEGAGAAAAASGCGTRAAVDGGGSARLRLWRQEGTGSGSRFSR